MSRIDQFRLLARYNTWMNTRLYDAAAGLTREALTENRGAFFGSILGPFAHRVVGAPLWLRRSPPLPAAAPLPPALALPMPASLDAIQFGELAPLRERRDMLDRSIEAFVADLDDAGLELPLAYLNSKGLPFVKSFGLVFTHFFNHQTHHRGQVTTLFSQAAIDVGVTDLLMLIPEVG